MKYYRDIEADETLELGDERMSGNGGWKPAEAVWIGQPVPEDLMGCFRRPVDLPTLRRVTPEAMAELERRGAWVILFRHREAQWNRYARATHSKFGHCWFGADGKEINPLDFCWYIVPDTIPEGRT